MRETPRYDKLILNEFYYKLVLITFGIIYWIYGLMPVTDLVFNLISLMTLAASFWFFIRSTPDFRKAIAVFIVLFSALTVIVNPFQTVNVIAMIYIWFEVFFFMYCDEQKSSADLSRELQVFSLIIVALGTGIILASLLTYRMGLKVTYYYPSITTTALHLGTDEATGALVGIMGNANIFADFLVIYTGMVLYRLVKGGSKAVYCPLLILALGTLYLSSSRGGLIGGAVIFTVLIFFVLMEKAKENKVFAAILTIAFILFLLALVMILLGYRVSFNGITGRDSAQMAQSTNVRVALWIAGLKSACSSPINLLFGVGLHFSDTIARFVDPSVPSSLYGNVHNVYIATLVSYGVFSAMLLVVYIVIVNAKSFSMLLQSVHRNKDMIPIIAVVAALIVINLVESDLYAKKPFEGTVFWLLSGYTYCILKRRREEDCS